MKVLKVYCPECDGQATIKKIKTEGLNNIPELYCCCNDIECGHTYVLNLNFSHSIRHSKLTQDPSNHVLKL
ncbi:ogr/Delta-like zinc finger family protein [Xenorhabdus sp. PR6a]|uniref:ogr/Delta-like zinc finger family protein n=1 Tax=Xenorhabdus sp. PR6a TaxID=3025877 RepID=UPI002359D3D3|nr:ogr/Delta-like zinc finger family protein [Xenorhabdus sp. PR6a]MDC9581200.1 ogr/Delta-like zinc finger family protein [Xenorhabdus sp. PR6a]